jgi:hypothetical protein
MTGGKGEIHRRIMEVVEKFREKGAISPEKAMTAQELGLPSQFEQTMHRWLGRLRIFVEINGKHYLDEERLRQVEEFLRKRKEVHSWSRYAGILLMLPIGLIVSLALFYFLVFSGVSFFPGEFLIILTAIMVVVSVIRILYWRAKRRYWYERW